MKWSALASLITGRADGRRDGLSPERVAAALYRGILGRDPDLPGLAQKIGALRSDEMLENVVRAFIDSPEFHTRFVQSLVPAVALPDLTQAMPQHYQTQPVGGGTLPIYIVRDDSDMTLMASQIEAHRYYDRFGVWTPVIDFDKQITAALVRGLGARSCFEFGCFTGPVLSLLADSGVEVAGAEVSHLAFAFAYPNIRNALMFGDLLTLPIERRFDVVLCMDVLEHVSPLLLDAYIEKLMAVLDPDGFLYLNAPMWGTDRTFGTFEAPYLDEWHAVGDTSYWRHWPCDGLGWPIHGHLVWAHPAWWERKFREHGLIRDDAVEAEIHRILGRLFDDAPGRRSLFVLRRPTSARSSAAVAEGIAAALACVPEVAGRPRLINPPGDPTAPA